MSQEGLRAAGASERAAWSAAASSITAALIGLLLLSATGHPRAGLALACGLVIGAFSAVIALRTLYTGLPFRVVSLARLMVQSGLAVGVGYLIGTDVIWIPALGLALSHLILGSLALRGTLAR
ncbi:MAG TPA: hypothetical protein VJT78_05515 [Candidatus Dormibacteraeota bacterium]|nr:hypothetical protein [Candidatus Dormibacteraeota bacterium]